MTTPLDIISSAASSIGALAPGETMDSTLAQDGLTLLNDLLDVWSNDDFMVTSVNEIIWPIGGGGTDWTVGPGGTINTIRPLGINSAFVRVATIDYPVAVLNIEQYELIGMKQLNGPWPRALFYNSGTPLGTLKLWPNPSSGEIHMFNDQIFTRFATLADVVQLAPGYNMAMRWALAELMMPGYGKTNPALVQMVRGNAKRAIASIKGTNMSPMQTVQFDSALISSRSRDAGWIMHGGFR